MSQPEAERLVAEGAAALRAGERERARLLLAQAVRAEPRNQQAWLFLAGAVTDLEQRRACLERVLALSPGHPAALKGLSSLPPRAPSAPRVAPPATALPAAPRVAPPATASPAAPPVLPTRPPAVQAAQRSAAPAPEPDPSPEAQPAFLTFDQLVQTAAPVAAPRPDDVVTPAAGSLLQRLQSQAAQSTAAATAAEPAAARLTLPALPPAPLPALPAEPSPARVEDRRLWLALLALGMLLMLAGAGMALVALVG